MLKNLSLFVITVLLIFVCHCAVALEIEKLANDDWIAVKSDNFTIITDLSAEKGTFLARDLEAYRYFSVQMMGLKLLPVVKPLTVIAISGNSNFKYLGLPENWAGVFALNDDGYAALANVSDYKTNLKTQTFARQVLFHEYNHFLVRFTARSLKVPMWYDEGMAEYMGTFKVDNEKVFLGDPTPIMFRAYDLFTDVGQLKLDSEKLLKTKSLPLKSKAAKDKDDVGKFYAQAFFLIHYFNSSVELRTNLGKYINYLNDGLSEDQALDKAFGMTYEDLNKAAKKYLNGRLKMRVLSKKEGNLNFPEFAIKTEPIKKAEFYAYMGYNLPYFGIFEPQDKAKILNLAATLNPTNFDFKANLLRYGLVENREKAEQELEAQAPQNVIFINYKADNLRYYANLLRQINDSNWQDAMKKARSLYRRAIKNDRAYPLSYFGLGDVYNGLPITEPLQEGIVGFETASIYSRHPRHFASLAMLNLRLDKGVDAISSVRDAISFSKEGEQSVFSPTRENLEMLLTAQFGQVDVTEGGLTYRDGSVYQGGVQQNKPQGFGKFIRPNGSYLEGNFVQGMLQGKGTLITHSGYKYEGEFQKGIARGQGKITYPSSATQATYEGEVAYVQPLGKGVSINEQGKYEGDFWYNDFHGKGTYTSTNGKIKLQGNWVLSRFEWPEQDATKFFGGADDEGKRNGFGVCAMKEKHTLQYCNYKNGVLQEKQVEPKADDEDE